MSRDRFFFASSSDSDWDVVVGARLENPTAADVVIEFEGSHIAVRDTLRLDDPLVLSRAGYGERESTASVCLTDQSVGRAGRQWPYAADPITSGIGL